MKIATGPVTCAMALFCAASAQAHFLWVDVVEVAGGGREARVYFSETASPGEAYLLDRIAPTQAWLGCGGGQATPIELSSWTDDEEGALVAPLDTAAPPRLEAVCRYGVFDRGERSVLLTYYAKYLACCAADSRCEAGANERLVLDIRPTSDGGATGFAVRFADQPLPGAKVFVTDPSGETEEVTADSQGRVMVNGAGEGTYALRTMFVKPDSAGELDGKPYDAEMHVATLTFHKPRSGLSEDDLSKLSAIDLLSQARAARAVWHDFSGFRCAVTVRVDDQEQQGKLTVTSSGGVELDGIDEMADGFVQQQLESLVMHRMPVSAFEDEEASYEPQTDPHVLGRLVRLADPRMGSTYRIRDDVIAEVNRNAGPLRFTISVLDVARNEEGHYMPHVYTVSFWQREGGALDSNHTYYHEWTRVGPYDLPSRMTIVSSGKDFRRVVRVDFSEHELSAGE